MKPGAPDRIRSLVVLGLLSFAASTGSAQSRGGAHADTVAAVVTDAADPVYLLRNVAGGFTYDLSIPGWPTSWSYRGVSPNDVSLSGANLEWDDPFTGRPRYDLVPTQMVFAPRVITAPHASPYGVDFAARRFDDPRPLTEATYWSSNTGQQNVRIVHAQRRSWAPRAQATPNPREPDSTGATTESPPPARAEPVVGLMQFTYAGATATGEYPGSKVERGRQAGLALEFSGARWRLGVAELYNRRSVGAHAGVNPPVFQRLGATVSEPTAVRETRRNDLTAFGQFDLFASHPLDVRATWTAATERYTTSADTTETRAGRISWEANQPLAGDALTATVRGNSDRLRDTRGFNGETGGGSPNAGVSSLFAGVEAQVATPVGRGELLSSATAGFVGTGGHSGIAANATAELSRPGFGIDAQLSSTIRRSRIVDEVGFARFLEPIASTRASRVSVGALGARASWRTFTVGATGFVTVTTNPVDYVATEVTDSVLVKQFDETLRVAGASFALSWRVDATRGLYVTTRSDLYHTRDMTGEARILVDVLPSAHAQGQLGFRQTLFQGDLIADVAIRGRAWSEMIGRSLHPQTGLLVASTTGTRVPASGAVDLVVSARIRTATIWILYENALSGTQLLEGNMIVDGYPLEQQRFRFGLHWPLAG